MFKDKHRRIQHGWGYVGSSPPVVTLPGPLAASRAWGPFLHLVPWLQPVSRHRHHHSPVLTASLAHSNRSRLSTESTPSVTRLFFSSSSDAPVRISSACMQKNSNVSENHQQLIQMLVKIIVMDQICARGIGWCQINSSNATRKSEQANSVHACMHDLDRLAVGYHLQSSG